MRAGSQPGCGRAMGPTGVSWCGCPHHLPRRLRVEVAQHCEDAAMAVVGGRETELAEDRRHVLLDRALRDDEITGDRTVGPSLRHLAEHLALPWGEPLQRI